MLLNRGRKLCERLSTYFLSVGGDGRRESETSHTHTADPGQEEAVTGLLYQLRNSKHCLQTAEARRGMARVLPQKGLQPLRETVGPPENFYCLRPHHLPQSCHSSPINQHTAPRGASPISPAAARIPEPVHLTRDEEDGPDNDDDSEHSPGDEQQNDSLIRASGFIFQCLKEKTKNYITQSPVMPFL